MVNHSYEEHFEEDTPYITLDGKTPMANSKTLSTCFVNKKIRKELKKSTYECTHFMNVVFESKQKLRVGDTYKWKLRDIEIDVVLLEHKELFVRGIHVFNYSVGIIE